MGLSLLTNNFDQTNDIWTGTFIMLFCKQTISKDQKTKTYEYPSMVFNDLNMVNNKNVVSVSEANDMEISIYTSISSKQKLTKEQREYLKTNYLQSN